MKKALVLLVLAACVGAAATTAAADTAGKVDVGFTVDKFVPKGKSLVANGRAVATYTAADGTTQSATQPFTAKVLLGKGARRLAASSATCSVLYLELDKLALTLLGLNVNLDKVILSVDANSTGGVLGSLFCKLAKTQVSLRGLSSTARHLTRAVQGTGLSTVNSGVGFSVPLVNGATTQTGTCSVLDLVLGPLDLKLLGLVVTLNQVHLTITADPAGGVLGSLFCSLAHATATVPPLPVP
jgi:hypothetical protein